MAQANAAASGILDRGKCTNEGYCLNFTYMPSDASADEGYVSLGAWSQGAFAEYPISYVGAAGQPNSCPMGRNSEGGALPQGLSADGFISACRLILYPSFGRLNLPVNGRATAATQTLMKSSSAGLAGCNPLQHGFSSACGCETMNIAWALRYAWVDAVSTPVAMTSHASAARVMRVRMDAPVMRVHVLRHVVATLIARQVAFAMAASVFHRKVFHSQKISPGVWRMSLRLCTRFRHMQCRSSPSSLGSSSRHT